MHWVELNRFACAARHLLFEGDATERGGERESNFVTFSFFGQRKENAGSAGQPGRIRSTRRGEFVVHAGGGAQLTKCAASGSTLRGRKKAPHGRFFSRGRDFRVLKKFEVYKGLSFVIST